MASALEQFDVRHVMLVSARDGLDELSITAPTDIIELKNGERLEYSVSPEQFGFAEGSLKDIQVSSSEESALLIQNIFANKAPSSALHITALNAGAHLYGRSCKRSERRNENRLRSDSKRRCQKAARTSETERGRNVCLIKSFSRKRRNQIHRAAGNLSN